MANPSSKMSLTRSKKRTASTLSDSDSEYEADSKMARYSTESYASSTHSFHDSDSEDSNHDNYSESADTSPANFNSHPSRESSHDPNCSLEYIDQQKSDGESEICSPLNSSYASDSYANNNLNNDSTTKEEAEEENEEEEDNYFISFGESERSARKRKSAEILPDLGYQMNPKVQRMMSKMAYKGKGLGKHEQGIHEPIEASKQKGRRGLGFEFLELEEAVKQFNAADEIVEVAEAIEWLQQLQHGELLDYKEMSYWMTLGEKKLTIDDETEFCNANVVKTILKSKSVFDRLDKHEMRNARTRSNPFETIRNAFFLNRAALKMANIDRMCDFMFTNPENLSDELIYFADVCAGPGGFSEYVLWRKRLAVKGFGFTLKSSNDFKLEDFLAGPSENFHPYYGPSEDLEKQGDVFLPENQKALKKVIMEQTNNRGVHFMMADGGFSVEGQENIQEILSKQLYLCQCLVSLMIVREGGHFVVKLFDLFTPFSVGLVYLMYRAFDSISIIKPNTSRPANSERYLVCRGRRAEVGNIQRYLHSVNKLLLKKDPAKDVLSIVPLDVLKGDQQFYDYIRSSNEELGRKQITGLVKIAYFAENKNMHEPRQAEMRISCLNHWQVPTNVKRMDFRPKTIDDFMRKHVAFKEINKSKPNFLNFGKLQNMNFPYSWYYTVLQYDPENCVPEFEPKFYVGLGGSKVYRCEKDGWVKVEEIVLPQETIVYGELVMEYDKEGTGQMKKRALHIIDAYMIDGKNLSDLTFQERNDKIKLTCRALWGLKSNTNVPVRAKPVWPVDRSIEQQFKLRPVYVKGRSQQRLGYVIPRDELSCEPDHRSPYFFVPGSIMFFKFTSGRYTRNFSNSSKMLYYFDGKRAIYEQDMTNRVDHLSKFYESFTERVVWPWYHKGNLTFDRFMETVGQKLKV